MTTFKVYLCAFQGGIVRNVEVPNEEIRQLDPDADDVSALLEKIFHWGQNIHQNVDYRCSVSVGDIILYGREYGYTTPGYTITSWDGHDNGYYRVGVAGFDRLDVDEADRLRLDAVLNYLLAITRRWGDPSGHVNGNAVDGVRRAVEEFRNEAGSKSPRGQTQEDE